jgi:C-methyltransferase
VEGQPPASSELLDMIVGKWVSQAICTAAELGIADLLKDGPLSTAEIAAKKGASEDGVYRLLRALGQVGLFVESEHRHFALTTLGTALRSDVPGSVQGFARFLGHDLNSRPWGHLVDSVKTGQPAFDLVFGMPVFDYVTKQPESAAIFNEAMASLSLIEAQAVVSAYDFEGIRMLVDVGGGQGGLLAAILTANPGMRGVLFEMPHALEGARKLLQQEAVIGRCEVVGGDFFTALPAGTEQEFQELYGAAGFRLSRVVAIRAPVSIVEGVAV